MGSPVPADRQLVFALHGFLGQATDWDAVRAYLPENTAFVAEDLFGRDSRRPADFTAQTLRLVEQLRALNAGYGRKIFLGYSLGGRLGLHLLDHAPELFDHYIFLSTNPGLPGASAAERQSRLQSDTDWSAKIKNESWSDFLREWNAQPVFEGSAAEPARDAAAYDLEKLRQSLVLWSLGLQQDFSETIRAHRDRVTWAVGERDLKYVRLAEGMKENGIIENFVSTPSGHRIWADAPAAVAELISEAN